MVDRATPGMSTFLNLPSDAILPRWWHRPWPLPTSAAQLSAVNGALRLSAPMAPASLSATPPRQLQGPLAFADRSDPIDGQVEPSLFLAARRHTGPSPVCW